MLVPIHYSFAIPGTPFALRKDLPPDLKAHIREALLSTASDPDFIRNAKRWYADPSQKLKLANLDAHYDSVRRMATLLDLDLRKIE